MNRFAELLDRLAYEPGRNNKLRLITSYFREVPDPDRGYALAALTGALSFKHAKPALIRDLIMSRTDPVLFALSHDYVGDFSETVALMWPKTALAAHNNPPPPTLTEVVATLRTLGKTELPAQLSRCRDERSNLVARLYSRSGEDMTKSFPDLVPSLHLPGAVDGELLVLRDGKVQSFNVLQQRLNRKAVSPKLIKEYPIHLRAYDLLGDGENDLRELPFAERRERLEAFIAKLDDPRIDLSPTVPFASWDALTSARADPASAGAGEDADAVEGVMLKRRDAPYLPGRPKGQWWKWKRDPHIIDAVLMYAQRGHGKRSSFYSDYTFGVWIGGESGDELVPVGKAYFGFTDEELLQIDRFVRRNTTEKFGPVRHVVHEPDQGLVLEVAFEGLARSPRHKSGVAMRFPRINRLRWDKPPREADRLETLERMLKADATQAVALSSGGG